MDKETFGALKRIIEGAKLVLIKDDEAISKIKDCDVTEIENWIEIEELKDSDKYEDK